jgi:hypothetical protein
MSEHHDVSQAWSNADSRLPRGWRVSGFRKNGMSWSGARSGVAAQASFGVAVRSARAESAGDPWVAEATGPGGVTVSSRREPTPDGAARDLVDKVRDHERRAGR